MSENSTPSNVTPESSHAEVAKKVVSAKRKYFYPAKGINVEASSQAEADKLANKVEVQDGELTEGQQAVTDAALASHEDAQKAAAVRVKEGRDLPPVQQNDEGDN